MGLTNITSLEKALRGSSLCDEALYFLAHRGRNMMILILESINNSKLMEGSYIGEGST